METDIHTTLPAGSPIMAYGTALSFHGSGRSFKIYAAIAAFLVFTIFVAYISLISLSIPKDPLIITVLPAKTHLPKMAPELWQKTLDTTLFPALVGASIKNGKLVPFAATIELWSHKGQGISRHWPYTVYTLEDGLPSQTWSAFDVLRGTIGRGNGRLLIRPSVLGLNIPDIDGIFTADGWLTSFPIQANGSTLPPGDMAIDLSALPDAVEPIEMALRGAGFPFSADLPTPKAVAWQWHSPTSSSLLLSFIEPLTPSSTSFLQQMAQPSTRVYALQDGTIMQELISSGYEMTSGTTAFGSTQEDGLGWRSPGFDDNQANTSICQHGSPILRLRSTAIARIQKLSSIQLDIKELEAASLNGSLLVCASFE